MLRYIIEPILCIILFAAVSEYTMANPELLKNRIWPATLYLGIDVAKTCVGWYQKTGYAYEINGSIDFNHILLNADYGLWQIQRDGRQHNGSFVTTSGQYFRIGLGYNFLTLTVHFTQFFIGCCYARSFFKLSTKE